MILFYMMLKIHFSEPVSGYPWGYALHHALDLWIEEHIDHLIYMEGE